MSTIKYYASRMQGWAYGDQGEHDILIFDSLDDAIRHAIRDNYYDSEQNEIRAGYVAQIRIGADGQMKESDDLPIWSAEDCLVQTGEVSKSDFSWRSA